MSIIDQIWPFLLPLTAVVVGVAHIQLRKLQGSRALEVFLMWQIVLGLGIGYIFAGLGHLFAADRVAESIGWPVGSPFQREVGMWDASVGFVGILCLKFRNSGFWMATIFSIGIFSIAAGLGHLYEMLVQGDVAPGNSGPVLVLDLFYPVYLIVLLYLLERKRAEETG